MDTADRELLERAVAGDQVSLERLLLGAYGPLAGYLADRIPARLQSVVSVDDVIQQTYVQVFRDLASFQIRREASFLGWLRTIAENRLRDTIRAQDRQKRGGQVRRVASQTEFGSRMLDLMDAWAGDLQTPSHNVARAEAIQAMQLALGQLPESHRRAVELRYFEGLSLVETAERLEVSEAAVRGLLDRARRRLREVMERASRYLSS